jgi:hypothetical protein
MPDQVEIVTLHRYFIWCNRMRTHFDAIMKDATPDRMEELLLLNPYMSYWYGGLYVVIEGWRELGLHDSVIDPLLDSPNVTLLRRYRNGVFHFQNHWFDEHIVGLMRDGEDVVAWVRSLNGEFGRYFLERHAEWKGSAERVE